MIKVNAISIGKIETLSYGNYKPMQSALNKIPFKGQMWLNRLGFVDDEQAYHNMVVYIKRYVVLVNLIINYLKMTYINYLNMQCLVRI